jgi:hypothetical protein
MPSKRLPSLAIAFLRAWSIDSMQRDSPEFISTQTGSTVTKDELRAELERQEQRYKEVYGGEVTTYAAQPEPERKPWRKRPGIAEDGKGTQSRRALTASARIPSRVCVCSR